MSRAVCFSEVSKENLLFMMINLSVLSPLIQLWSSMEMFHEFLAAVILNEDGEKRIENE